MNLNENSAATSNMVTAEADNDELARGNIQSSTESQNTATDFNQNQDSDYYEVISADGSIGVVDISDDELSVNDDDADFGHTEQTDDYSLNDLPFVPKFEFPSEFGSSENSDVPRNEILRVNRIIPHKPRHNPKSVDVSVPPNFNPSVPPPNFNPSVPPPNFSSENYIGNNPFPNPIHHPLYSESSVSIPSSDQPPCTSVDNAGDVSQSKAGPSDPNTSDSTGQQVLGGDSGLAAENKSAADWLDENGDPIKGAFDSVDVNSGEAEDEDSDSDLKGAKIEYVFSVKERKLVPVKCDESSDGALINSTVSLKNIAGNLGLLESQLATSSFCNTKVIDAEEEKKLYEASKSGADYKAAVEAAASENVNVENQSVKKEHFNRFKRNRFTVKKEETEVEGTETAVPEPRKDQEDVALESQAVTEILREVQRGAARAKEYGALGWQKCPVPVTNKTFLRNTLVSTLREPYKPPNKRGRVNVGLYNKGKDRQHKDNDGDSRSRSSRSSRSSHSSRSGSSSYSRSRSYSGSSYSSDGSRRSGSRGRQKRLRRRGGGRGGWGPGHNQYYDEAWAAYAAQYGYPWYGPEAYAMYYGPEGWSMDAYAAMYYGDPQAWAEYEAYYGSQHFNNPRGGGMRSRGRGWRGRGRGRGGFPDDFREYERDSRSPEYRGSGSRSALSRSWSREHSRSRSRSRSRSDHSRESRLRSQGSNRSRSHSNVRDREKSRDLRSSEKNQSGSELKDKKKKKKKKKKHHKSKKSKHKRKGSEGDGDDEISKHTADGEDGKGITDMEDKGEKDTQDGEKASKDNDPAAQKGKKDVSKKEKGKKRKKHKSKDREDKEGKHKSKESRTSEEKGGSVEDVAGSSKDTENKGRKEKQRDRMRHDVIDKEASEKYDNKMDEVEKRRDKKGRDTTVNEETSKDRRQKEEQQKRKKDGGGKDGNAERKSDHSGARDKEDRGGGKKLNERDESKQKDERGQRNKRTIIREHDEKKDTHTERGNDSHSSKKDNKIDSRDRKPEARSDRHRDVSRSRREKDDKSRKDTENDKRDVRENATQQRDGEEKMGDRGDNRQNDQSPKSSRKDISENIKDQTQITGTQMRNHKLQDRKTDKNSSKSKRQRDEFEMKGGKGVRKDRSRKEDIRDKHGKDHTGNSSKTSSPCADIHRGRKDEKDSNRKEKTRSENEKEKEKLDGKDRNERDVGEKPEEGVDKNVDLADKEMQDVEGPLQRRTTDKCLENMRGDESKQKLDEDKMDTGEPKCARDDKVINETKKVDNKASGTDEMKEANSQAGLSAENSNNQSNNLKSGAERGMVMVKKGVKRKKKVAAGSSSEPTIKKKKITKLKSGGAKGEVSKMGDGGETGAIKKKKTKVKVKKKVKKTSQTKVEEENLTAGLQE